MQFLQAQGLKLLAQNWRCRRGELDLVMSDNNVIVFVEVRARRDERWGGALASIDERKRGKLILAAETFLQQNLRWSNSPCRFDAIAITLKTLEEPALEWIRNAFEA